MRRAFSLIEVAVASAIAGVIGLAAISAFAVLNQQLVQLQRETVANDVAKSTIDALITRLQSAGGGPIRPHMAVWVEDVPDGDRDPIFDQLLPRPFLDAGRDGADRLTYAQLIPSAPICEIVSMTAAFVVGKSVGGVCCLDGLSKKNNFAVYLVKGESHRQVVIEPPVDCKSAFVKGPLAPIDSTPPAKPDDLTGGSIAAVSITTIYLNKDRELREFEQSAGFSDKLDLANGSSQLISSDVFDFQAQLGYDVDADGRLIDVSGSGDEWRFNAAKDTDTFTPADLRMAGVSVVVGVPQVIKKESTASVVGNEPLTRKNFFLRSAAGRAAFRNIFVFN